MFSKFSAIKSKKYSADSNIALLLIHGGCFTEGDETWNAEQAQSISSQCSLDVFTIDFAKTSLSDSINDIKKFYTGLYHQYKGRVGILGTSSGGFLVLYLLNDIPEPSFVVLACPVMDPEKREDMLLSKGSELYNKLHLQQLQYFTTKPYPTAPDSNINFHIIAAKSDENVPLELIESESRRFPSAVVHETEGTHAVSYLPNDVVNNLIKQVKGACLTSGHLYQL